MAAGSQRVILLVTGLLLLISIIVITLDESSSNNIIFVVIFSTSVIILLWKMLSSQNKSKDQEYSSPTNLEKQISNQNPKIIHSSTKNDIPDPLEQEIDIPLM
tara:strand:+ start:596 stop:904 length:309 start_codon:yes stop_codon:yes gene_type:complete